MSDNTWFAGFNTPNGRIALLVMADNYLDNGTQKHRNHRVEIRLNDRAVDQLALTGAEAVEVAGLLNQAAAHIRANT